VISRTILPVISQPDLPGLEGGFGLGDLNETLFFSPARPGKIIWGVGPSVNFPIAWGNNRFLSSDKWTAGPGLVVLSMPGRWVIGALVNQQWSFAGDDQAPDVNAMLLQYFVNYNFSGGWYFTSAPVNTADWSRDSADRYIVPIGGGFGKIIPGKPPLNVSLAAYYNVVKPDNVPAADWQLRLQVQLMFPRK
jgi:hypothetical protein